METWLLYGMIIVLWAVLVLAILALLKGGNAIGDDENGN